MSTTVFGDDGVLTHDFDYSTHSDREPVEHKSRWVKWIPSGLAATAVAATAALVLAVGPQVLNLQAFDGAGISPFHRADVQRNLSELTRKMQARALLARRVFKRVPHPGENEPDPDYGF